MLVLIRLKYGHTYEQLAAGFGVGIATVYRCVAESVGVHRLRTRPRRCLRRGHTQGVRRSRRDDPADRPDRRQPPLLLRQGEGVSR
ncbi:hypothetical protein [Streptomyces hygroscopicus]|uniref:hypothetical protein n=1 Tax=Streptomyces hygroscopicus TaxID=1912 RepID=UPI003A101DC3